MKTYITRRADFMANLFIPTDWTHRAAVHLADGSLMWQWCKSLAEARAWVKPFKARPS
jgi:hypothetical protein